MFYTMTHNAQLTKACLTFMLPLPFVQAKLDGPPRLQLKVRGTQWTSSSKLFLKIPVLQAHFCWLGDLEKIICPGKESVSGTIQGVYVYLMSGIAAVIYISEEVHNTTKYHTPTIEFVLLGLILVCFLYQFLFPCFCVARMTTNCTGKIFMELH